MGQIVRMPDGTKVRFPDDMPKEEIRALIEEKFPTETAARAAAPAAAPQALNNEQITGLQDQSRRQFLNSVPIVGPAANAAMDFGPKLAQGIAESVGDAVMLPMDVLTNKAGINDVYIDPQTGRPHSSDALIERTVNAAGVMTPGSRIPAAPKVGPSPALRKADEFGIPLTEGQRTGSLRQITKEEALRQQDGPAQNIVRRFDEQQREAIAGATDTIGRKMGGDAANMPELVTSKVREKVAFSKQRAGALYDVAFDGGLTVKQEALDALPGFVRQRLDDEAVIIDPVVTPSATRALQEIEAAGLSRGGLDPDIRPGAHGQQARAPNTEPIPRVGEDGVTDVTVGLKGLEQVRKRLVGLKGTTPEDVRAVSAVKRAFDQWLDDGVDQMLITGDDAALQALKQARAETGVYKSITSPKPGDSVGKSVSNLLREETTAEEIANWLYGADIVSPNLNAPKVASRIKSIVGADSPEWAAVRTAAWHRLVKDLGSGDVRSSTMLVKRIEHFLNDKGSSLSRILYSPAERQHMVELVQTLKRTITPRDATNPSRSGHVIAGAIGGIMKLLAGAIGFGTGGMGGLGWGVAAILGYPVAKNALRTGAAKRAVKQGGGTSLAPVPGAKVGPSLMLREKLMETKPSEKRGNAALVRLEA